MIKMIKRQSASSADIKTSVSPISFLCSLCSLSITIAILSLVASPTAGQSGAGSCHLRELDLCAASLLVLTQAPDGLATTDNEINKQCVHSRDADSCLRNYMRRCMTPIQRELMTFASNSSFELLEEYCTKGSKLRQNYLKHSQCLNQLQKKQEHKGCMRDLQNSLELLTTNNAHTSSSKQEIQKQDGSTAPGTIQSELNGKRLQMACCAYRRFESCLGGHMEKRCGKETIAFVRSTIRRATSRLPETVCRAYKPDGQECRALLPKAGATPRGSKSNSIISRLLSAYTGL